MSRSITVISSMATARLLAELTGAWRDADGGDAQIESVGGVDAARRIDAGEAFDLAVLAADAIDRLAAAGRLVAASVVSLVRSPVAIAVRKGHARPAVATEAALRASLLAARSVGYSTGPSGKALLPLFARWGIDDALGDRLVQAPAGTPVGALIARGEVELGFQQLSELMHVDGIELIEPMPAGLEIVTTFAGAVCASATEPATARAFLDFIRSPAVAEAKRRHGMQPT